MDSGISEPPLDRLSRRFQQFALECRHHGSLLYEQIAMGVAADPEMLALAARARSVPVPNLFFAATHFLLLKGAEHPVARFYPSLSERPDAAEEADTAFRSFCLDRQAAIGKLISARRGRRTRSGATPACLPRLGW